MLVSTRTRAYKVSFTTQARSKTGVFCTRARIKITSASSYSIESSQHNNTMLSSSNHRRSLSNTQTSLHQDLTVELVTNSSKVFDEAEKTLREAYEHRVASHGAYDHNALATLHTLAELIKMEDLREGVALLEECQRGYVSSLGAHHRVSLGVMLSLSDAYVVMGRHEEAYQVLHAVHRHFQRTQGKNHPDTFSAGDKLAAACAAAGTEEGSFVIVVIGNTVFQNWLFLSICTPFLSALHKTVTSIY